MKSLFLYALPKAHFPGEATYAIGDSTKVPCFFDKVNYLNIFVGANNSGKSRLLRGIMQQQHYLKAEVPVYEALQRCVALLQEMAGGTAGYSSIGLGLSANQSSGKKAIEAKVYLTQFLSEAPSLYGNNTSINLVEELPSLARALQQAMNVLFGETAQESQKLQSHLQNLHKALAKAYVVTVAGSIHKAESGPQGLIASIGEKLRTELRFVLENALEEEAPHRIYIPTLRSARSLFIPSSGDSPLQKIPLLYHSTVCTDYNIDPKQIEVETGLDLYQKIKRTRNQVRGVRRSFEAFEKFLQENFFHGREFELVAKESDDLHEEHLSVYIDGEERDLHFVGDGIQALIMLLYPVFMARPNSYVFVEEPEINMHPGMQRLFVNTLLTHPDILAKQLTFFLTTHSNHLLDTSLESRDWVTVFLVKKVKTDEVPRHVVTVSHTRDIRILSDLGVLSSSVFLANCSIWVEGVTDRKYLQRYLECYAGAARKQRLQEELHYTFLEYAGSNLVHYAFGSTAHEPSSQDSAAGLINGLSISNKIMVIADQDQGKEKKHGLFSGQESPQFTYLVLPALEVENLLTPGVLRASLPAVLRGAADSSKVVIDATGYAEKGLGAYLSAQLKKQGITVPEGFKAQSGTLGTYYKNKLADAAIDHITWEAMSEPARQVARQVHEFIASNNQDMIV